MKKIIFIFLICQVLVSCSDLLDENPKSVAAETFYNTPKEADAAVLAALDKYRNAFNNMEFCTMQEASADYSYGRGSWTEISEYYGLKTASNVTRAGTIWSTLYKSIRDCNIAIERLPEASMMNDTQKASYIGELRFLRAFSYYYLVRLYKEVPLRTEKNMSEYNLGKSSVDEIYSYIIDDLKYATENAPETPRLSGAPCRYAAYALLADVYLQRKQYPEAAAAAKALIDSGKYSLTKVTKARDFEKVFGANINVSPEEIFYLKNDNTTPGMGWQFVMCCAHPKAVINGQPMLAGGLGWYGIYALENNKMIQDWDDADFRKEYNILPLDFGLNAGCQTYIFCKYYDPKALDKVGAGNDWPVIRYADVLLNYAEAVARQTNAGTQEAIEYVNKVHRRAYGYDQNTASPVDFQLADYTSFDKFLRLVVDEQGYECMNEAKRWLYLCRVGIAEERIKEYKNKDVQAMHFYWPIPVTEFQYNDALTEETDQNEGY